MMAGNTYSTPVLTVSAPVNFSVERKNDVSVWLKDEKPLPAIQNPVIQTLETVMEKFK